MGIANTTRAKAQAAVSKAEADVAELTNELKKTQTMLEGSEAAGELLDSVSDVAIIGSIAGSLRDDMGVDKAQLRAQADDLTAKLSAAQSRLEMAKRAQAAVLAVVGAEDK
jgi:hypothetical protein